MSFMDIADFDELRASQKYGPGFAFVLRAISYGDDLDKVTAGLGKAVIDGPWLVAFQTPKGSCTLDASIARGWADQLDGKIPATKPQDAQFISALRGLSDECDRRNASKEQAP